MVDKYPSIQSVDEDDEVCPTCGGKLYFDWDDEQQLDSCIKSECCDEGGGTTGYVAICRKDFYNV